MPDARYILGHSEDELDRLMLQSAILKPITTRLLREAGIKPGMRVLDLGCGAGDVSMLAGELVGPAGLVVGIDRSADALAMASERAHRAMYENIKFRQSGIEEFVDSEPFDLAIGRYVLVHQDDPASIIRSAASHVRTEGIVAFHEVAIYGESCARPSGPLLEQTWSLVVSAFQSMRTHADAAGRMSSYFHEAGLSLPTMFCEVPVGNGPDSPLYAWWANTLRTLLPQLEKIDAAAARQIGIDTLEERLRNAAIAMHGQVLLPLQFCGWTRI